MKSSNDKCAILYVLDFIERYANCCVCVLCVQGRMPYGRTMSMEQRWQDLANLLSLPDPSHAYHHFHPPGSYPGPSYPPPDRGVLLHNATLAPPVGDLANATSYPLGQYLKALCCIVIAK